MMTVGIPKEYVYIPYLTRVRKKLHEAEHQTGRKAAMIFLSTNVLNHIYEETKAYLKYPNCTLAVCKSKVSLFGIPTFEVTSYYTDIIEVSITLP